MTDYSLQNVSKALLRPSASLIGSHRKSSQSVEQLPQEAAQPFAVTSCHQIRSGCTKSICHMVLAIPRVALDQMFMPGQSKSWCFHLTLLKYIKWCPVRWWTQALRARIIRFSLLLLHLVWTLCNKGKRKKTFKLKSLPSLFDLGVSYLFTSAPIGQANFSPTENRTCNNCMTCFWTPGDAPHLHATHCNI